MTHFLFRAQTDQRLKQHIFRQKATPKGKLSVRPSAGPRVSRERGSPEFADGYQIPITQPKFDTFSVEMLRIIIGQRF